MLSAAAQHMGHAHSASSFAASRAEMTEPPSIEPRHSSELWTPTLQNEHMSIGESSSSSLSHTWHSPFWSSSQTFPPFRAFIAMSAPMVREFCG